MNIKITGVGKCGSRICYDFFAYTRQLPSSYQIRTHRAKTTLQALYDDLSDKLGISEKIVQLRIKYQALTGTELLRDKAWYVLVDSDLANNEITQSVVTFVDDEKRESVFPGTSHKLASHDGGCDFHIVSEGITNAWEMFDIPNEIKLPGDAEIIVYAFSIGGGTGGGASPRLAAKLAKEFEGQPTKQIHVMGAGVLPESDEIYFEGDQLRQMDNYERYNVGRFFSSLYGRRNAGPSGGRFFDSLWLVGNDMIRWVEAESPASQPGGSSQDSTSKLIDKRGIALINAYVAGAMCTICNASSQTTHASSNFDASEMNNRLNGHPFISAFAHYKPDVAQGQNSDVYQINKLFRAALRNPKLDGGQVFGLSVPQQQGEMEGVESIFDESNSDLKSYEERLSGFIFEKAPLAFKTCQTVVVLYGQGDNNTSRFRVDLAKRSVARIFQNSDISFYDYKHSGVTEYLVILLVNPFVRFVQNAIYYYLSRAWCNTSGDIAEMFDRILENPKFDSTALERACGNEEKLEPAFLGVKTVEVVQGLGGPVPFSRLQIVSAFGELHRVLHHRKKTVSRSRI